MAEEQQTQEKYERVIDLGDGSGVQRFVADSMEELVDALAKAQEHATRKIREQARTIKTGMGLITPDPETPVPEYKPRKLSDDEIWRMTQEIGDPAKARGAIRSFVEAELGTSLDDVRETMRTVELARRTNQMTLEANEWAQEHKADYYACDENKKLMLDYLESHKMALTKKNCDIAFNDLRDSGLLVSRPEPKKEETTNGEAAAPPRPKTSSLRPTHSSTTQATARTPAITWDDINKMSPSAYDERMRDPAFRKMVDALPRR